MRRRPLALVLGACLALTGATALTEATSPAPALAATVSAPAPDLADHALIGYWHNFTNPSGDTFPLGEVDPAWDVINVAFAENATDGNVGFTLDPGAGGEERFVADIAAKQAAGVKVVLSLGGQNGSVTVGDAEQAHHFATSVAALIDRYGFDGIDVDLESGVSVGAPITQWLPVGIRELKGIVGDDFYLSMAPEWVYVEGGYTAFGGPWGAYLPVIEALRDDLTVLHPQYYNNGAVYTPYSTTPFEAGSTDQLVATARMLIEGFDYGGRHFDGLRPDQVGFGVPSGPSSAGSGFTTPAQVNAALDCVTALRGCGTVTPTQAHPDLRGVMTWSINWDRHDGFAFSGPVGSHLDGLGRAAPAAVTAGAADLPTSDTPDFGPNVTVFDPGSTDVQAQVDAAFEERLLNPAAQFGDERRTFLFKPGSYDVFANLGFYTSLVGLGRNPDDVTLTRNLNVDSGWNSGDESNATQNFWRSVENLSVAPEGGTTRWAVSQAAPMRRVHIKGNLTLAPSNQDNGQGYASGGYLADSRVDGGVSSGSQQQWYTRNSSLGSWEGGVWNMVFSGVQGAPAADLAHTVLASTPLTREKPYLHVDDQDRYSVFVPDLATNSSGTTWPDTPGESIPLSRFYVARPGDTAATLNSALAQGLDLFFTPGVYDVEETIRVTRPDTVVFGLGMPTLVPSGGVDAMHVADVGGVNVSGLLFDAGPVNSPTLLTVGEAGVHTDHADDPILLADNYFRVGGPRAGKNTTSLVVNSDDTIVDHSWIWRADHGAGVGWTANTADTGIVVNGDDVLATGLFVEHYQEYQAVWNGERGRTIFFQNEMPYDPPSQGAWASPTGAGSAAYKVADGVQTHELWGGGAYTFFNVDPSIRAARGFEVPVTPGVRLHNVFTVSLGDVGGITHVVNDTGGAVPTTDGNTVPQYVPAFP